MIVGFAGCAVLREVIGQGEDSQHEKESIGAADGCSYAAAADGMQ